MCFIQRVHMSNHSVIKIRQMVYFVTYVLLDNSRMRRPDELAIIIIHAYIPMYHISTIPCSCLQTKYGNAPDYNTQEWCSSVHQILFIFLEYNFVLVCRECLVGVTDFVRHGGYVFSALVYSTVSLSVSSISQTAIDEF